MGTTKDTTIRTLREEVSTPCFWCGARIWTVRDAGPSHYIRPSDYPPIDGPGSYTVPIYPVCGVDHGEKAAKLASLTKPYGHTWQYTETSFSLAT